MNKLGIGYVWSVAACLLAVAAPGRGDALEYIQHDARISGVQINHFSDDGRPVTVVVGRFRLVAGDRTISGRKAVLWISRPRKDKPNRHVITAYVEDNARIVDADGSTTTDRFMLVKLHIQGRLTLNAVQRYSKKPLDELEFYRRARTVYLQELQAIANWRARARRRGVMPVEPPMVVRPPAPKPDPRQAVADNAQPTPLEGEDSVALETLAMGEEPPAEADQPLSLTTDTPPSEPPPPPPVDPVRFSAPLGVTIQPDPENPARRIAVARGEPGKPVVLQQGPPDSEEFLTLRSEYAVVFSRKDLPDRTPREKVPYAPPILGMGPDGEKVTGVYLEGDVVIRRGERHMTATSAYYDFAHNKAVVLKPVFRTVQEQRNIPIYIRAEKARILSPRETKFRDAVVSTSDFATPTYSLNAREVTFRDETPYDTEGEQLGERAYSTSYEHAWLDVRGMTVAYLPGGQMSFEEGHSPLRKAGVGTYGKFGLGGETQWHLFRLLGLVRPEGMRAHLNANFYEKGALLGVDGEYERQEGNREYSGYFKLDGVYDIDAEDTFGREVRNIRVDSHTRGRALVRHKEFLPRDWQIQGELSLLCDRNFLREFYPDEFWTGKEQENLIYARKQRDNWALTALLKARLNDFLTQTESFPEAAGYLIGHPLADDRLTYFGEARMGGKRYFRADTDPKFHEPDFYDSSFSSNSMFRFDTRQELDMPLEIPTGLGPLNVVPYLAGRFTYWSDSTDERDRLMMSRTPQQFRRVQSFNLRRGRTLDTDSADHARWYGQLGVRANMHFWRVYNSVDSRLWDVHRLKHIVTPELRVFAAGSTMQPKELYPLDPNVEEHIRDNTGISFGIHQRLQTKRGPAGDRRTVDWMRLNLVGGWFAHDGDDIKGDGTLFFSRPEYSYQRPFLNYDYTWNISDSIALLSDGNFDLGDGQCDLLNLGVSVNRDKRLSYYTGVRYIEELDSAVGTFGLNYRINKKYSLQLFEQYDFLHNGGTNSGTRVTVIRKMPRWYMAFTFIYNRRYTDEDEIALMLTLWPEGVPEVRLGTGRVGLLNQSSEN